MLGGGRTLEGVSSCVPVFSSSRSQAPLFPRMRRSASRSSARRVCYRHAMPDTTPTPPQTLDAALEVSPGDWAQRDFYHLMTSLVIPRPIGWMSTISESGVRNLAPYSYFNLMGSDP